MNKIYIIPDSEKSQIVTALGLDPFYFEGGSYKISQQSVDLYLQNGVDINSHCITIYGESLEERYVEVEEPELSDFYTDVYKGLIYIKKDRWYGLNISFGEGYERMNYNYSSLSYTNIPSLSYLHGVGSSPNKKGKLRKIVICIARASSTIDNLQLFINKMGKNNGSSVITNKTLLHENTSSQGHYIEPAKPYYLSFDFDEEVTTQDVIQILFNSSSNSSSTRYLYSTEIKFYYE